MSRLCVESVFVFSVGLLPAALMLSLNTNAGFLCALTLMGNLLSVVAWLFLSVVMMRSCYFLHIVVKYEQYTGLWDINIFFVVLHKAHSRNNFPVILAFVTHAR